MNWNQQNKELIVGDFNDLEVARFVDFGLYLESPECDILLPKNKIPPGTETGEILPVFIYKDSENRLIATTDKPKIIIHQCACLEVMDVNKYGAFLDWGIENQLLVPFREQTSVLQAGAKCMVYLYLDHVSDRLVATMRLEKHISNTGHDLAVKQKVDLLIWEKTTLGYKAIINQKYIGLLYQNEIDQILHYGDRTTGYIKKIREDNKIDLSLKEIGIQRVFHIPDIIIRELKSNNGFLAINDKSSPEEIKKIFNISKSDFKKAVGMLLRKRYIEFRENGIQLK